MDRLTLKTPASIDPLTAVVEENAIRKLLSYYLIAVDAKKFHLLSEVFTADAVAEYGFGIGTMRGADEIAETLKSRTSSMTGQHFTGTCVINLLNNTTTSGQLAEAVAVSYVVVTMWVPAAAAAAVAGAGAKNDEGGEGSDAAGDAGDGRRLVSNVMYEDELTNGGAEGWKIARRKLTYMGPISGDVSGLVPEST